MKTSISVRQNFPDRNLKQVLKQLQIILAMTIMSPTLASPAATLNGNPQIGGVTLFKLSKCLSSGNEKYKNDLIANKCYNGQDVDESVSEFRSFESYPIGGIPNGVQCEMKAFFAVNCKGPAVSDVGESRSCTNAIHDPSDESIVALDVAKSFRYECCQVTFT
ncbi:hypothetical protein SVAN01_09502 [Stagonosporopsis vannaccii]|nr:hypothetical protein SVAN01_09502 [Stagonosporopsis vannaccii]